MEGLNFEDLKLENITNPNYQVKGSEDEKTESKTEDKIKDSADDTGSDSKGKSTAEKFNEDVEKGLTEKETKEEKKESKETKKGKEEEVTFEEEEEDEESEEKEQEEFDLDLTPLYSQVLEGLGIDVKLEDIGIDPHKEEDLPEFIKAVVKENSKPAYASEDVEAFDKYIRDGGDPKRFLETVYKGIDYEKIDLDKASDNEKRKLVHELYQSKYPNKDYNWIEKKIDRLETTGVLDDEAEEALEELKELDKSRKENLFKEQEKEKEERQKQYENYIESVKTTIHSSKEFGGIPVGDKDKEEFYKYLMVPDKKTGKTGYQKDLEKQEDQLKLAYYAFKKYNFDSVKKEVKTEVTKDLKKNLSKYSTSKSGTHVRSEDPTKGEGEVDYDVLRKLVGKK